MNHYTTREKLKAALITASFKDAVLDAHIAAASREIDRMLGRRFIPETRVRYFHYPQMNGKGAVLFLDEDLLSVSAITSQNGDVTLVSGDYYLEPVNDPPYKRIEINAAATTSTAEFAAGDTPQRAVAVTGSWGYSADTKAAGTVASGLSSDATATTFVCSNGSLIGVGDTLLIETEQLFVSDRSTVDTTANTNGALTTAKDGTSVVVTDGTKVKAGEVILINSEKMYVHSVSGNTLSVIRAFDGSTLASHLDAQDVYAYRTLTVTRGANGTTAATHADSTAIARYAPPAVIEELCRAEAIFNYQQDESGQTGVVGGADGGINVRPASLLALWERAKTGYLRPLSRVL